MLNKPAHLCKEAAFLLAGPPISGPLLLDLLHLKVLAKFILLLPFLYGILACSILASWAEAQSGPNKRDVFISSSRAMSSDHLLTSNTTFEDVVSFDIQDFHRYDRRSIKLFERLIEVSQPRWNPRDADPDQDERAAHRAFTVQAGRGASILVKGSELYPAFLSVKRGLDDIRDSVRFSVQADEASLVVSKERRGHKILEFNLEFNVSQGLDPRIRIGELVTFRYDLIDRMSILEYELDF
ncbi:MAG: hypothetical protein J5J00_06200 [Deltaproteobacteria bacterium]|nr:hypothetical protein [Deltaproteobacteria bacterium]